MVVGFVVGVGLMSHAFSMIFLKVSDDESFSYLFSHKYFYFNKSCICISVRSRFAVENPNCSLQKCTDQDSHLTNHRVHLLIQLVQPPGF